MTIKDFWPWERDINRDILDYNTNYSNDIEGNKLTFKVSSFQKPVTANINLPNKTDTKVVNNVLNDLTDFQKISEDLHKIVDKYLKEYSNLDYTIDRDYDKVFKIIKFLINIDKEISREIIKFDDNK